MDFGKMKEQMSGKIKEELTQKIDEVKADIEKKFSNSGGSTTQQADQIANPVEGQKSSEARLESVGQTDPELETADTTEEKEETTDTTVVAESDSAELDDDSQREKEVA